MKFKFFQCIEKYSLIIFFVLIISFAAIFKISFKEIWNTISSLKPWHIIIIIGFFLSISLLTILTRKFLLHILNERVKLKNLLLIHFSSLAANYSTPAKIGFPITIYLLKRLENVPFSTGTAVVLIELSVEMMICGIIAFIGSFFYFNENTYLILGFLITLLIVIIIYFFFKWLSWQKNNRNVFTNFIQILKNTFRDIKKTDSIKYITMKTFIQIYSGINLIILTSIFSVNLSLWQAVVAGSTSFFLGAVSMIPMGLGVRDASILFYLNYLGVPTEIGLSIVTIQRLFSTGLSFILGGLFGTIVGLKNLNEEGLEGTHSHWQNNK